MKNTCLSCITATAGTRFGQDFWLKFVILLYSTRCLSFKLLVRSLDHWPIFLTAVLNCIGVFSDPMWLVSFSASTMDEIRVKSFNPLHIINSISILITSSYNKQKFIYYKVAYNNILTFILYHYLKIIYN